MTLPKKSEIYNTLNATRHIPGQNTQLHLFDSDEHPNPQTPKYEYWLYSDLHNIFGSKHFPIYPRFGDHTWRALQMPIGTPKQFTLKPTNAEFYNQHIATIRSTYKISGVTIKRGSDQQLSRYACWCMTHATPQLIFARTYFIAPIIDANMPYPEMKALSYQFARIHLRNQLKEYEKIIGGILNRYNGHFSLFNHNMTRAFFYGYDAKDLKEIYKIPIKPNDPLSNYMGAASLNTRIRAIQNAITRFNNSPTKNINTFDDILYQELTSGRIKLIHDTDIRPEQDIQPTHISKIESRLNQTETEFILRYSTQKIR